MTIPLNLETHTAGEIPNAAIRRPDRGGRVLASLEHRVPPPILAAVIAGSMALAFTAPDPGLMPAGWNLGVAGTAFLAAGVFGFPALLAFGKARTTINPVQVDQASALVTTGIYRITRNPMYVAFTLLLCAWAAWIGRPLTLIGPAAFVLFINRFQIVPEERALAAKFGDAFAEYRRSVRRWL